MVYKGQIRSFLWVSVVVLLFSGTVMAANQPLVLETDQLYLVFDPRLQGTGEKCELKVHQFKRYAGNPVVQPDSPWEFPESLTDRGKGRIQLCSVLWEPDNRIFKMWFFAFVRGKFYGSYATSRDGIQWEKPKLGLCEYKGSKENNIFSFDAPGHIYRDLKATDPERRYVKWSLDYRRINNQSYYDVYRFFSRDGLRWVREFDKPVLPGCPTKYDITSGDGSKIYLGCGSADGANVYWLDRLNKYICFHNFSMPNPNPAPKDQPGNKNALRSWARFESDDGITWNTDSPTMAFMRDEKDREFDEYIQFYNVSIHPVGDLYLAFPWLYHSNAGNHDIGLAYSIDTIKWDRPFRGQYVLPRAPEGDWDSSMIQGPATSFLVEKDGMWWMYYSASPYLHRRDKRYFAIGLAQMPIGRVVSARCWRAEGSWTVGPVKLTGQNLLVNAAVLDNLRVTILDEQNQPIPDYQSKIVRGNAIEIPVRWEKDQDLSALDGQLVKLRFELNDAEIFGFKCK